MSMVSQLLLTSRICQLLLISPQGAGFLGCFSSHVFTLTGMPETVARVGHSIPAVSEVTP